MSAPPPVGPRFGASDRLALAEAIPSSLLRRTIGSRRSQIATGIAIGFLLLVPVNIRLVTRDPSNALDEAAVSALVLFGAVVWGTLIGLRLTHALAKSGWMEQLPLTTIDPLDLLRAVRRRAQQYIRPHLATILIVRALAIGVQALLPSLLQFSALIFLLQGPGGGAHRLMVQAAVFTIWAWAGLLAVPLVFEGAAWIALATHLAMTLPHLDDRAADFAKPTSLPRIALMTGFAAGLYLTTLLVFWFPLVLVSTFLARLMLNVLAILPALGAIYAQAERYRSAILLVITTLCLLPGALIAREVALWFAGTEARRLWEWNEFASIPSKSEAAS